MPRLLEQVRSVVGLRHYSLRTEEAYLHWVKEYILFHRKRHPSELGAQEVSSFLSHLATDKHVAASTQNAARQDLKEGFGIVHLPFALERKYRLEDGYDIRTVQELLGHKDVRTTMIYTHVLNRGGKGVKSPLDKVLALPLSRSLNSPPDCCTLNCA